MDLNTLEAHKTVDRFYRQQDRVVQSAGYGDTDVALKIARDHIKTLANEIEERLKQPSKGDNVAVGFEVLLRQLDNPMLVAAATLQAALHSIALEEPIQATLTLLGASLEGECWAHKLTHDNPTLAARVERNARAKHSKVVKRRKAAKVIAAKHGFKQKRWGRELQAYAGRWLLDVAMTALPELFQFVQQGAEQTMLTLQQGAEQQAQEIIEDLIQRRPVFLPMQEPPLPWTQFHKGGPRDQRETYARPLLRTRHKDTGAACRGAIRSGEAQPALDAVNTLQAVPWRINTAILDVLQECVRRGLDVPGLPGEKLDRPFPPDDEDDEDAMRLWHLRLSRVRKHNRMLVGERLLLTEDLETAERMRHWAAFYTPMNLDWRGRVYAMTQFNFQREDRVRALFQFAHGEPIGEDTGDSSSGLWWLKVHVANCGDFDKVSKKPLEDRVAWVNNNLPQIVSAARSPMESLNIGWWKRADKPFLFLAACMELSSAMERGCSFLSALPVSFDGSCSGLQHLCAMTRAPEGGLVNLTPSNAAPADVYATVAAAVNKRVTVDANAAEWDEGQEWRGAVAKLALAHGIDRKVCKRNVMTYSYSSKKFGMAAQQQEDLMDVLDEEVLTGKRAEHPFEQYAEGDAERPSPAARYLAGHVYESIEAIINLPAQAMAFLQKLAKTMAHEGKPLRWTTPAGLPWINRYHEPNTRHIELYLHDRRITVRLSDGSKPEIDKAKAAAGVAPNFVHALDAAHLMLTANACARAGITAIATVHDSFGCLASRAKRFNEIIREQFVDMYQTHDVLAEVLAQAKHDLTQHNWNRLPEVPQYGELNLEEVKHAQFAFA